MSTLNTIGGTRLVPIRHIVAEQSARTFFALEGDR